MTRNLSIFLDLLRFGAALLVFAGHSATIFQTPMPAILAHSAKEGVVAFFVLSGFVIAYVTAEKEADLWAFARARLLRLYTVVPTAIVVLLVCYWIGRTLAPAAYAPAPADVIQAGGQFYGVAPSAVGLLRYLTFTNEVWFSHAVIITGAPFWSLAFEAAYYVGFAAVFYTKGRRRWLLGLLWAAACGPRIVLALPLWLVGVATYHLMARMPKIPATKGAALLGLIVVTALMVRRLGGDYAAPLFEYPAPSVLCASMGYYLSLALLEAAAILVFAASSAERTVWPGPVARAIRYLAGATFTLYLMHMPVETLISVVFPQVRGAAIWGVVAGGVTLALMLLLAEAGERRKSFYQHLVGNMISIFTYKKFSRMLMNN